jgi:hypothetical protein
MQAVTATFKQETTGGHIDWAQVAAAPLNWLTRIFGCWHQEMSRPFTVRAESYRVCLECGAHRRFDPHAWEMTGPYYYEEQPQVSELYRNMSVEAASVTTAHRPARPVFRAAA